jgi:Histidine kinase-like ATPase domain
VRPVLRGAWSRRAFLPEPRSVPAARRFLREELTGGPAEQWLDDALVAVSETATNAVLHAHSTFEVLVQVQEHGVCVQLRDTDSTLPARRESDGGSTTGRGLAMVAAVSAESGVQLLRGAGKAVWFCLGTAEPWQEADELLDRWDDRMDGSVSGRVSERDGPGLHPAPDEHPVLLAGMPVRLWLAAREHHNTLIREFCLAQQDAGGPLALRLGDADRARSLVLTALRAQPVWRATMDLPLAADPQRAGWFAALRDVLDEAERLAADGRLLARPGPPAILAVRRWACDQVLGQLDGAPPERWHGELDAPGWPLSLERPLAG